VICCISEVAVSELGIPEICALRINVGTGKSLREKRRAAAGQFAAACGLTAASASTA
jgi:hypothetical protein